MSITTRDGECTYLPPSYPDRFLHIARQDGAGNIAFITNGVVYAPPEDAVAIALEILKQASEHKSLNLDLAIRCLEEHLKPEQTGEEQ